MSQVQQSLCLRFRTPKSHAVPRQDRQHLVAVQRHRPTRRTSAAAAAAAVAVVVVVVTLFSYNFVNGKGTFILAIKNLRNKIQCKPK